MRFQNISDGSPLDLETPSAVHLDLKATTTKQLKTLLRTTAIALNDSLRDDLWLDVCARHHSQPDPELDEGLDAGRKLPLWVDTGIARFFALNASAKRQVSVVLWTLSQNCPHVTLAPLLYPLTALFLHFHDANATYRSLYALMHARHLHFIGTTKTEKTRDAIILVKLTNKFGILRPRKFGADARDKLRNSNALDSAFAEYLQWIFCLPFHHCVRVVDCFLVEGEKFLFRIALTLALLFERTRKQSLTLERMRHFCETIQTVVSPQQLIAHALKVTRLSRKDILRAKAKAESRSVVTSADSPLITKDDVISTKDFVLGARIAPRRFRSAVVTWHELDVIWEWLPERVVVKEPIVVFCSEENGNSLQTFFTLCSDYEPTLLLVQTVHNQVFGAFCSSAWARRLDLAQSRSGQYFGTGETFLFAVRPQPAVKWDWVGRTAPPDTPIQHSAQLFQSASNRSLCVGSGGGQFGLFIDESLTRGQTARCETFANDPLCAAPDFEISVLEVIAFC